MAAVLRLSGISGIPDWMVKIFSLLKEIFHFLYFILHFYASVGNVGSEIFQFNKSFLEFKGHFRLGLFLATGLANIFEWLLNLLDKALQMVIFHLELLQTIGQFF